MNPVIAFLLGVVTGVAVLLLAAYLLGERFDEWFYDDEHENTDEII